MTGTVIRISQPSIPDLRQKVDRNPGERVGATGRSCKKP
jgi:hypothetical protein